MLPTVLEKGWFKTFRADTKTAYLVDFRLSLLFSAFVLHILPIASCQLSLLLLPLRLRHIVFFASQFEGKSAGRGTPVPEEFFEGKSAGRGTPVPVVSRAQECGTWNART